MGGAEHPPRYRGLRQRSIVLLSLRGVSEFGRICRVKEVVERSGDSRRCGVSPRRRDAPGRCVSLGCDARRMNQGDAASRRVGK
jgi:hypothetical protein